MPIPVRVHRLCGVWELAAAVLRDASDAVGSRNSGSKLPHSTGFVAVLLILLQGCAATAPRNDDAAVIAELTRQADQWDHAIVRKDRAAVAANMAEDFRQIGSSGKVADKNAFLDGILSSKLQIDPYTVEDFDVRLYGDVALLSGSTAMTGRYDGRAFSSHYRYIDVYARVDGTWKVVSVQTTEITP